MTHMYKNPFDLNRETFCESQKDIHEEVRLFTLVRGHIFNGCLNNGFNSLAYWILWCRAMENPSHKVGHRIDSSQSLLMIVREEFLSAR